MTLWISILGFASGRTGWVITDGSEPPLERSSPPDHQLSGVFNRFSFPERSKFMAVAAGCSTIKIGTVYRKGVWAEVSQEQLANAEMLEDLLPPATGE